MSTPVKIQLSETDPGHIEIDGHDITDQTARFFLSAVPGKEPKLTIQLIHGLDLDGAVHLALSTATRRALLALGWTPPADTPHDDRELTAAD